MMVQGVHDEEMLEFGGVRCGASSEGCRGRRSRRRSPAGRCSRPSPRTRWGSGGRWTGRRRSGTAAVGRV